MPFVKLDCGILNSTLWFAKASRDVFITALLMAEPVDLATDVPQLQVFTLEPTGWEVPAGWYGLVPAAGVGIIERAKVGHEEGFRALEALGKPEDGSRSQEFGGRRLVRVDGGYLVLNYMKYRDRDYGAKERMRRLRARRALQGTVTDVTSPVTDFRHNVTSVTHAEYRVQKDQDQEGAREAPPQPSPSAPDVVLPGSSGASSHGQDLQIDNPGTEVQVVAPKKPVAAVARFDRFWAVYPNKTGKQAAFRVWERLKVSDAMTDTIVAAVEVQKSWPAWTRDGGQYIPHPSTWLNAGGWDNEPPTPVRTVFDTHSPRTSGNREASQRFIDRLKGVGK